MDTALARLLGLVAGACAPNPGSNPSGFGSAPDITTAPISSSGDESGPASSSSSTSTTSSSSDGGSIGSSGNDSAAETAASTFDLGSTADFGGTPAGCKGKIDFLFVISRHGLMDELQDRLIAAFPAFLATIQEKFADFDYHIMVVTGGPGWGAPQCDEVCPTPAEEKCVEEDYPCDLLGIVTECDKTIGAGTVFPAGGEASNEPCAVDGGRRFLTHEQTDLEQTFACVAKVGMIGFDWIGEALSAAVSPQFNWKGGCNEGFLRDDALLMITMISSTYDYGNGDKPLNSLGTPEEWAQAVLAAKKGDPEAVVMLDILDPACPPYDGVCKMVKMFPYRHIADCLEPDYGPIFDEATSLVEVACEGFSPPPG
jgi:hypothetical protein